MDSSSSSMVTTPTKRFHSHGSQSSFSSSSSCSSPSFRSNSFPSDLYDPSSPLSPFPSFHISRVPFSWEQHPGIPKKSNSSKSSSSGESLTILPLPPSASITPTKRFNLDTIFTIRRKSTSHHGNSERDPFTAALVECCKDSIDDHEQEDVEKYWKVSRVITDRFGFMDRYASCKKSCAVAESVILLPRSLRKA